MSPLFGTKAKTLERLAPLVTTARVLPQMRLTVDEWQTDRVGTLARLEQHGWLDRSVIVRSSALQEDGATTSLAGQFTSVPAVHGRDAVSAAIDRVILSYQTPQPHDQVFLQPQLSHLTVSGVAFGIDPVTGGPYVVVNDQRSPQTGAVTSGTACDDELFYWLKGTPLPIEPHLVAVIGLLEELERLLGTTALDVEFAWDEATLFLLQVRRLLGVPAIEATPPEVRQRVDEIVAALEHRQTQHPQVLGQGVVWGAMPDWNPAEMIGLRPRPLAKALYRACLTDRIWAEQRRRYGYRDVTGAPLMECFGGQALIDVRASFTSFIPASVPDPLAQRFVQYYIDQLRQRPELHDKVEIDLVFHCWTFDLQDRLSALSSSYGFQPADGPVLEQALQDLTARMMQPDAGPWYDDCQRIAAFEQWLAAWELASCHPSPTAIRTLLHHCRDEAASAFAGLARAGFVAVSLVHSLVKIGAWTEAQRDQFFHGQQTVLSRLHQDRRQLPLAEFLRRYGHLRPGTYDILVPRYDEAPETYHLQSPTAIPVEPSVAPVTVEMVRALEKLLVEHRFPVNVDTFVRFLSEAIQMREYGKFVYSRGISALLRMLGQAAAPLGYSLDDVSFADSSLWENAARDEDFSVCLDRAIALGKATVHAVQGIVLPPVLLSVDEVRSFRLPRCQPNFVTGSVACGRVQELSPQCQHGDGPTDLAGAVVFLPSADPGFDWIFSTGIAGLVTMFGGANSHMAIRAREWNLPAVIGVGEVRYRRLVQAPAVRIDGLHQLLVAVP